MSATDIGRDFLRELLMLVAVSPLIFVGRRNSSSKDGWKQIGLSVVLVLLVDFSTNFDGIFGIQQPDWLHWNWGGKLACIAVVGIFFLFLPIEIRARSGLLKLPPSNSAVAVGGFLAYCFVLGCLNAYESNLTVDVETLAFQLLMPSLAEEPVFRAILPALLSVAIVSPWKIAGAQLGWWWIAIQVYFALGHSLDWSPEGFIQFHMVSFLLVGMITGPFGWISARCGSVWPCIVGHSIVNSTYVAIGLLMK